MATEQSFEQSIAQIISSMYQYQYENIRASSEACVFAVLEIIRGTGDDDVRKVINGIISRIPDKPESQSQYWTAVITFLTVFYYDVHSLVKVMIASTFDSLSPVLTNDEFRGILIRYILEQLKPRKELKPTAAAAASGASDSKTGAGGNTGQRQRPPNTPSAETRRVEAAPDAAPEGAGSEDAKSKSLDSWKATLGLVYDGMIKCAYVNPDTGNAYPAREQVLDTLSRLNEKIPDMGLGTLLTYLRETTRVVRNKYAAKDGTNMPFRNACADMIAELRSLQTVQKDLREYAEKKKKKKDGKDN